MIKPLAQATCNICHPMLMATYAMIVICLYTPIVILPTAIRLFMVGEVFFYSCLIPFITAWLLYKFGMVHHWTLRERKDRKIPLAVTILSFAICGYSLYSQGFLPRYALTAYFASTVVALICLIVSFWWKISGHALAFSALTTVTWIYYFMFDGMLMPLALPMSMIPLLGLVCSFRVYLGRHTLAQVYAGTLVSIVVMLLAF